jgi:hypothetical protein
MKYDIDLFYRLRQRGTIPDPNHPWEPEILKTIAECMQMCVDQLESYDKFILDLKDAEAISKGKV